MEMRFLYNKVFKEKYDRDKIKRFYELLSEKYPEAQLYWKNFNKVLPEEQKYKATDVEIRINGKLIFTQSEKGMGVVNFKDVPRGELVEICKQVDLVPEKPDISTGVLLSVLYTGIVVCWSFYFLDGFLPFILTSLAILLIGLTGFCLSVITRKARTQKMTFLVIFLIGVVPLSPLSIMNLVLMRKVLELDFYKLLH